MQNIGDIRLALIQVHYKSRARERIRLALKTTGLLMVMGWFGKYFSPTKDVKVHVPFTAVEGLTELKAHFDGVEFTADLESLTVRSHRVNPDADVKILGYQLAAQQDRGIPRVESS